MRAAQWLVGLSSLSAFVGAVATGCSGDNGTASSPDASTDTAASGSATSGSSSGSGSGSSGSGSSGDAGRDAAIEAAPLDCGMMVSTNVATYDSGNASWACIQRVCADALAPCAANVCCDNGVYAALLCSREAGPSNASAVSQCFTNNLNPLASDPGALGGIISTLGGCLNPNQYPCMGGGDGSAPDGGGADAPTGS
jgi:hypothetical protein